MSSAKHGPLASCPIDIARFAAVRRLRNFSLSAWAREHGISRSNANYWLNGASLPPIWFQQRLEDALGLSAGALSAHSPALLNPLVEALRQAQERIHTDLCLRECMQECHRATEMLRSYAPRWP